MFLNILECDQNAPNVIYLQTPTGSVVDFRDLYSPLSRFGVNVFAIDLTGVGRSQGSVTQFSTKTLIDDIDTCVALIKEKYSGPIHLFGGAGTGGILGQFYVSGQHSIRSYIQYGLANYRDLAMLKNPLLAKWSYPLLPWLQKLVPHWHFTFGPKAFNGKHAEEEAAWYAKMRADKPESMKMNICIFKTLMEIMLDEESVLKEQPSCPVLLFAPKYDRYFSMDYIEHYYRALNVPKEMYEIEDSHLSFVWRAEEICQKASQWIHSRS